MRVWLAKQNYTMLDNLISTHTPVRVWHSGQAILEVRLISTHTPVRVWPDFFISISLASEISTHTPVRVWLKLSKNWIKFIISTHTPVRVWLKEITGVPWGTISTHTPVRVWLRADEHFRFHSGISTHTPVRVWRIYFTVSCQVAYFNSHTREGVTNRLY